MGNRQIQYFVVGDKQIELFVKAHSKRDVIDCLYSRSQKDFIVRTISKQNIPSPEIITDITNMNLMPLKKEATDFIKKNKRGYCRLTKTSTKITKQYCPSYISRICTKGFPTPYPDKLGESIVYVLQQNTDQILTYQDIVNILKVATYDQIRGQIGKLKNSSFVKLIVPTPHGTIQLDPIVKNVDMKILTLISGGESYDHKKLSKKKIEVITKKTKDLKILIENLTILRNNLEHNISTIINTYVKDFDNFYIESSIILKEVKQDAEDIIKH